MFFVLAVVMGARDGAGRDPGTDKYVEESSGLEILTFKTGKSAPKRLSMVKNSLFTAGF